MINTSLLDDNVQEFIKNFDGEIYKILLGASPFPNVTAAELAEQIESRRKIEKKLPTWYNTPKILFPPKLNLEQTSSEITAQYKASLVSGNSLADITGGYGIDSFFFSENFKKVHHFEINTELSKIVSHNLKVLKKDSISCFAEDGLKRALEDSYDVIYVDPSRRHKSKGKVFFLKDSEPNIVEHQSEILKHCKTLMIKTSPMLDISRGLEELSNVTEVHIVAVDNDVKELLWILKDGFEGNPSIKTVNFKKNEDKHFDFQWNHKGNAEYSLPKKYLYEPNAAILKSGAFDLISETLNVYKLNKNTHLYTNDTLIDFPGRRFTIEEVVPYSKTEIKKALTFKNANISIRNFPESVEKLRKKWKIKDGGDIYLFFITALEGKKQMLICSKA